MPNSSIFKNSKWNRYNAERNYRRLIVWTEDNAKYLPPDYIPALKAKYGDNHNRLKAHLYGEFCPLYEGNAYPCYLSQVHDIDDTDTTPYAEIKLTFDFNANPVAWVAVQRMPLLLNGQRRSVYVAQHEADRNNTQLDDAVAEFCLKFRPHDFRETPISIFGDRTGHAGSHKVAGSDYETIKNLLYEAGFRTVSIVAAKQVAPQTASVDALNRLFLNDLLFISTRCKLLKRSLMATTWKEGKRELDKPAGETWTHHSDAVKYWAWQETRHAVNLDQPRIYGRNI